MNVAIDKWREPHGSEAGRMGIKADHVAEVDQAMQELGAEDHQRLQSLDRLTVGDLIRLSEFFSELSKGRAARLAPTLDDIERAILDGTRTDSHGRNPQIEPRTSALHVHAMLVKHGLVAEIKSPAAGQQS